MAVEGPLDRALGFAYRSLARRDRTEVEVRRHFQVRDVEPEIAEEALAVLAEQGYVDDARYARRFAEDRRRLDAWGSERIERQLLAAGVAPEHVEGALAAQESGWELEAAVALLRRRFPQPPDDDRGRSRALGVLVRRGYDLELAHDAVRAHERGAG